MKTTKLILLTIIISTNLSGQDSLWTRTTCNEILTITLPAKYEFNTSSYIKAYGGYLNENFYGLQYYDTIFNQIENENNFQIALTGYVHGRITDTSLKKYVASIIDTTVGGTKGIMVKLKTNDPSEAYKQIFYYITLANSKYYWFYAYAPFLDNNKEINSFFNSISFNSKKVKESTFVLTSIYLK